MHLYDSMVLRITVIKECEVLRLYVLAITNIIIIIGGREDKYV